MKKLISVLLTSVTLFACAVGMSGCRIFETKADKYTVEEHLERIAKKVDARYMSGDYDFTSYELYPLYNENEKMEFVLVEFEPQGFIFVPLHSEKLTLGQIVYLRNEQYLEEGWHRLRYEVVGEGQEPSDFEDDVWKLIPEYQHFDVAFLGEYDNNGERVSYYVSPYKLAGVLDQRLYCVARQFVAIKTENGYLNLISMKEFVYFDGLDYEDEPAISVGVPPKNIFYL